MKRIHLALLLIGGLIAVGTLQGAPATMEAKGQIVDQDGNPLQGAIVTIHSKANPKNPYTGKTNKKGRYFIPGMFTPKEDDEWIITVAMEGYVATKINIETRTVNRVLFGDPWEKVLKPEMVLPTLRIPPLGTAQVDFELTTEALVAEQLDAEAAARAVESGETKKAAAPQRDPWDQALTLAGAGNYEASIEFFDKAIEKKPEDAERRDTYAKVLYKLDRFDESEVQVRKAIELAPPAVEARILLYNIYESQGRTAEATTALEEARAAAPENVRVLERLAYAANAAGDQDKAVATYVAITEVDPQNSDAWLTLAGMYAEMGNEAKSAEAYERVSQLDPDNAHQIFFNLGALIVKKSNRTDSEMQRAVDAFRKAVEIKPDYAVAYKELGLALLGTGDRAGAVESLGEYCKLAPEDASMKMLLDKLSQ